MIKIDRSADLGPAELRTKGEEDLLRLRALAISRELEEKDFRKSIYSSNSVKSRVWNMQAGKCCYCEREYEQKYSHVEHFRPKTVALREGNHETPGYWWLAYRFENLYFGCAICNQFKGTWFPLAPGTRALEPEEDPRQVEEFPLLLDPGFEDPEAHLTFIWIPERGFQIAPRNDSERGRWTIQVLKLDRDDLSKFRLKYYKSCLEPLLERFAEATHKGNQLELERIRREAQILRAASAPYALLARIVLREI
jgi:uncharacterized protein (TIGR02646 family)